MFKKMLLGLLLAVVSFSTATVLPAHGEQMSPGEAGSFRANSGPGAGGFSVPDDMELIKTLNLGEYGLVYERYQQFHGNANAQVMGGQISLYRDESGEIALVMGKHFPDIRPSNSVGRTGDNARDDAERDVGKGDTAKIDLMIDPHSGKYFHRVEISSFDSRWVRWTDASSGALINKYNAIAENCPSPLPSNSGCGVNGDVKDMAGITAEDHAASHGGGNPHWDLSTDANYGGRQLTYDYGNKDPFLYYITDSDNIWDMATNNRQSPGQPALVDAQYHANVTDRYFQDNFGFDWVSCYPGGMQSVAHYNKNYNNAFWNGTYTIYGDGDNSVFRELSGGLDVVAHEHTHGLTECTSNLIYQNEAGALNESFSDMLGNSAEFYAQSGGLDLAGTPDWSIGEEVYLPADTVPGFRNMLSPAEDGDPDHYSERYTGTSDNGGVHTNSGIPNHAYYLLVEGGSNAGEALGHQHSGPVVVGIGLADAEQIFFLAFIALPSNATMDDARAATIAVAETLFGAGSLQANSTRDAWDAVGVGVATPPPPSDNTAPSVDSVSPPAGSTSVSAGSNVSVTFSEPVNNVNGATFKLTSPLGEIPGSVTVSGDRLSATLNPDASLESDTVHTLTATTDITDDAGNSMTADFTSTFATEAAVPDPTPTPGPSGINLTANGYKVKGVQVVELSWSGTASNMDIYRDGSKIQSAVSGDSYTDNIGKKGGGDSYYFQVCEAGGMANCSNTANVNF